MDNDISESGGTTDYVCVGSVKHPRDADSDTLLILSMGVSYWMMPEDDEFRLYVKVEHAEEVMEQLERSRNENAGWPFFRNLSEIAQKESRFNSSIRWGLLCYWVLLGFVFWMQTEVSPAIVQAGRLDVLKVTNQGEVWRCVTALTLHGDFTHLLGNLGMGSFFLVFVFQRFGLRVGALLIVLSGVFGNGLNALLRMGDTFYAVGASTSVFGSVGVLAGAAIVWRFSNEKSQSVREFLIPVMIALTVLAWWGSSGQQTDTMGHLFGLCSGLFLGVLAQWFRIQEKTVFRILSGVLALSLVGVSWLLAVLVN